MKRFIYILLFAGIIGAMCITPIKSEFFGDFGIKEILGDNYNNYFLIGALAIVVIFPLSMLLASFGEPRHVRNAVMFVIIALIIFVGWPYLFRIGFNLQLEQEMGGLELKEVFNIAKESVQGESFFKLGTGAIIAGIVACAGFILSVIMQVTSPKKKNKR